MVRGGTVETAANIDPAWIGLDAVDLFSRATGRLVAVVNDADAAGLAEVRFGAGRSVQGVIAVITLGTGIGSAVLVDGSWSLTPKLGHLPLHHGDAGELGRRIGPRTRRAVLEAVRPSASGLSGPGPAPDLAAIDHHRGGVSASAQKYLPKIELRTPIVPAQLLNDAGIIGAAMYASNVEFATKT